MVAALVGDVFTAEVLAVDATPARALLVDSDLVSVSAEVSVGSRLDSANRSARGIATASATRATSTFTTRAFEM